MNTLKLSHYGLSILIGHSYLCAIDMAPLEPMNQLSTPLCTHTWKQKNNDNKIIQMLCFSCLSIHLYLIFIYTRGLFVSVCITINYKSNRTRQIKYYSFLIHRKNITQRSNVVGSDKRFFIITRT